MAKYPIYLGDTIHGERLALDFDEASIRFVLLAGMTGSGKSIFHSHLYQEFMCAYSPEELGFVFLDMTRSEFSESDVQHLAKPVVYDTEEAFRTLEDIAGSEVDRKLVIHIEECDMVYRDRARMEVALDRLIVNENTFIIYSTSRIDPAYLTDWMEKYIDMKVVFRLATEEDSELLIGSDAAFLFREPGERMLVYGDKMIKCVPL